VTLTSCSPPQVDCYNASKSDHLFSKYRVQKNGNRRTNRQTNGYVKNVMPPASLDWWKHKNTSNNPSQKRLWTHAQFTRHNLVNNNCSCCCHYKPIKQRLWEGRWDALRTLKKHICVVMKLNGLFKKCWKAFSTFSCFYYFYPFNNNNHKFRWYTPSLCVDLLKSLTFQVSDNAEDASMLLSTFHEPSQRMT